MDETLFQACRMFIVEQSGFEKSLARVDAEAATLASFIEKVRPKHSELDFTPGALTVDYSEAREDDARWIASNVIFMQAAEMAKGVDHTPVDQLVSASHSILVGARKKVAEAQTKG